MDTLILNIEQNRLAIDVQEATACCICSAHLLHICFVYKAQ